MEEIVHDIKLGENSHLISKYSTNKKIYYSKAYFDNNDLLKSYIDVTKTKNYGVYFYYKIGCIYEGFWENNMKTDIDIGIEKRWDGYLNF
jgi:hypothetical protein